MHKLEKEFKSLYLSILEKLSESRPLKFRRRQISIDTESITIGSHETADVKLREFKSPFLFEIKYFEGNWWLVNPLKNSELKVNGKSVLLETELKIEDEIQIDGHKLKPLIKKSLLVEVPRFASAPETDEGLWNFLMDEADFDEIMINGVDQIYIDHRGTIFLSPWRFKEDKFLQHKIYEATQKSSGWASWRKNRTLRIHAALPPVAEKTHLTIRKARANAFDLKELEEQGFGTGEEIAFLKEAIKEKKNIIISGGTSTGKTSLLRSLVQNIPAQERLIIAEEETEVDWAHPHTISLESGRGNLRQTVIECLRMRPSRLIVAEVRGAEAFEMLQAMNTGHSGSMTTVHANSAREALHRIESLALCSDLPLSLVSLRRQISQAIHVIVQLTRTSQGKRKIDQIVSISGMENDLILLSDPVGATRLGLKQKIEEK